MDRGMITEKENVNGLQTHDEYYEANLEYNQQYTPLKCRSRERGNEVLCENERFESNRIKKNEHLEKLTPGNLKIDQKYEKNRKYEDMPFSPLSHNDGSSHSTIKIKCGDSEQDSEIKFTYSKSKITEDAGTPTFTERKSAINKMKETIYQTPKVEQERAIGCSGETKSILNTDYVQISKKLAYSNKNSLNQTPILMPNVITRINDDMTCKESSNSDLNGTNKIERYTLNLKSLQDSEASLNKVKNAMSCADSSDHFLRKRIYYNDSSLKKGGGGTGLMYGPSDKSSSSSKKVGKKGSASSYSTHSVNSNSEKSSQKQFDRLINRNGIMDFYEFHNDQIDPENIQSIITPIKIQPSGEDNIDKNSEEVERNSGEKNNSTEECKSYVNKTIVTPISDTSKLSDKNKFSEEKRLGSEENKESVERDSPYYSGSSNITPYKQLETITEQPTSMEMDNTNCVKSSEQNSCQSNDHISK